jgi:hypothetical protein
MSDAVIVTVDAVRSRASTQEALLTLAVPQEYAALIATFLPRIGEQVAVAFSIVNQKPLGQYGAQAALLRKSGFFRIPVIWPKVGDDRQFLDWLAQQRCAVRHEQAGPHGGDVVAAHVRRIAEGAGTGIKPSYSAIPLCDSHHRLQHDKGESALALDMEQERVNQIEDWCWQTVKHQLGFEHWNQIEPSRFRDWAKAEHVDHLLPMAYQ